MRENRVNPSGIGCDYHPLCLDQVLENVLPFLTSHRDRNSSSLICKSWYRAESLTGSNLFIANCYAVSPHRFTDRFRRVTSVTLKGKLRFADFNLMPLTWECPISTLAPLSPLTSPFRSPLSSASPSPMTISDSSLAISPFSRTSFSFAVTDLALPALPSSFLSAVSSPRWTPCCATHRQGPGICV